MQTLEAAHPLGIHHLVTAKESLKAASAGFEGKIKIWSADESGEWKLDGEIVGGYALGLLLGFTIRKGWPEFLANKQQTRISRVTSGLLHSVLMGSTLLVAASTAR